MVQHEKAFRMTDKVSQESLKTRLIEQVILDGELQKGQRLPSTRILAQALGTNPVTLMRVIGELVGLGILKTEEKRGVYLADVSKCRTQLHQNPIVGAILPYSDRTSGYYFNEVAAVLEQQLSAAGLRLIVQNVNWVGRDVSATLEDFIQFYRVSGLIVRLPFGFTESSQLKRAIARGIPVVLLDGELEGMDLPAILVNNKAGGEAATSHLLEAGHRRVAFLRDSLFDSPGLTPIEQDRFEGYCSALQKKGLTVNPEFELNRDHVSSLFSNDALVNHIKRHKITAVFAYNDENAVNLIRYLNQYRLRVPEDISVIGFDNIPNAPFPLSTIDPHKEKMGLAAAELVLGKKSSIRKNSKLLLEPEVVNRSTVKKFSGV